ncbi:MAG TPA: M23 family metallopeptidase, partial [Candidatus Latescibacteria bacterium]|nr:M23 family metallopeptidase [Candidatus Latescibacterota bacterium]
QDSLSAVFSPRPWTPEKPEFSSRLPEAMAAVREKARYHPSIWPVSGWISKRFEKGHTGIDIAGVQEDTVRATADGVVSFTGKKGDLGLSVVLEHGKRYRTVYGHCQKLLVRKGQKVHKGQAVALLGSTGHSTGFHLHYEVWEEGKAVDPEKFLIER